MRKVSIEEALQFTKKIKGNFVETSAKTGYRVQEVFDDVGTYFYADTIGPAGVPTLRKSTDKKDRIIQSSHSSPSSSSASTSPPLSNSPTSSSTSTPNSALSIYRPNPITPGIIQTPTPTPTSTPTIHVSASTALAETDRQACCRQGT